MEIHTGTSSLSFLSYSLAYLSPSPSSHLSLPSVSVSVFLFHSPSLPFSLPLPPLSLPPFLPPSLPPLSLPPFLPSSLCSPANKGGPGLCSSDSASSLLSLRSVQHGGEGSWLCLHHRLPETSAKTDSIQPASGYTSNSNTSNFAS